MTDTISDDQYHAVRMMVLELLQIQGINIHHSGAFIPSRYKVVKLRSNWNLRIKVPSVSFGHTI